MEEQKRFCDNCRQDIPSINFTTHSAFCIRNIKICKLCSEPVKISDERTHLKKQHCTGVCDRCSIVLEKWMLPEHQKSCAKRLIECEFCNGEIPFDKFSEHSDFCSSRTEKCLICKKYVMLKEKKKHTEIHMFEKELHNQNIQNEISQNIINEVISHTGMPEEIEQNQVDREKPNTASAREKELHHKNVTSEEAGACALDVSEQFNRRYTTCHICRQTIPWIDFTAHVPSCATQAGKCSRCGEYVPGDIKKHVLKECKMLLGKGDSANTTDIKNYAAYRNKSNTCVVVPESLEDNKMEECKYCKQLCSTDRIEEHMQNCTTENYYECSMCAEKIAEKDKSRHESFECKTLLNVDGSALYAESSVDTSKNQHSKNKPKNFDTNIRKKDTFSKNSTDKSYAESVRKSKENKTSNECKSCCPCHKNPGIRKHAHTCQKYEKRKCLYCAEETSVEAEENHLKVCRIFKAFQRNSTETTNNFKRAVPKQSNIANLVKPPTAKCKFCNTTLNADIVHFHESECVHQPIVCEKCDASVPMVDIDKHTCKQKDDKEKFKRKENVKKTESRFCKLKNFVFGNPESGDTRNFSENASQISSSHAYDYSDSLFSESEFAHFGIKDYSENFPRFYNSDGDYYHYRPDSPLGFEQGGIPCEFCDRIFPPSQIVLHETGCAPDLVRYVKKDSKEEESKQSVSSKSNAPCDNLSETFFSGKKDVLSSSSGKSKKYFEANNKPGEFLKAGYTIEKSEDKPKSSKSSPIQSVWNVNPVDSHKDVADFDETSSFAAAKETEKEFRKIIPEKFQEKVKEEEVHEKLNDEDIFHSDDEISQMLDFIHDDKCNVSYKDLEESASAIGSSLNFHSRTLESEMFSEINGQASNMNLEKDMKDHLKISKNTQSGRENAFAAVD